MAESSKVIKSTIKGKIPQITDLQLGEIAINSYDGKVYIKKDNGVETIIEVGSGGGSSENYTTNTPEGLEALNSITTGEYNTAVGHKSLWTNATASFNTGLGGNTLYSNTDGYSNVGIGYASLYSNTIGYQNTALGTSSLYNNIDGYNNVAIGGAALTSNVDGYNNVAIGYQTLYSNTSGGSNIANGYQTLYSNTIGYGNIACGYHALYSNTEGYNNIACGYGAGENSIFGINNILIGNYTGSNLSSSINAIDIMGGNTYKISVVGTTDFTIIGAVNNVVGEQFSAIQNAAGSPSGSAEVTTVGTTLFGTSAFWENEDTWPLDVDNVSLNTDDGYWLVDLPWTVDYVGVTYSQIGIGTNCYLTFGAASTASNNTITGGALDYTWPELPKIMIGAEDNSGQRIFYTTYGTAPNREFRVRFEGNRSNAAVIIGEFDTEWEAVFYENARSRIDIVCLANVVEGWYGVDTALTELSTFNGNSSISIYTYEPVPALSGNGEVVSVTQGNNIAIGDRALGNSKASEYNIALGNYALYQNNGGNYNVACGYYALYTNSLGEHNIACGYNALYNNTTGSNNIALGSDVLYNNTIGVNNIAIGGSGTLEYNTTGSNNTAIGDSALRSNIDGYNNIGIGENAMSGLEGGNHNIGIGFQANGGGGPAHSKFYSIGIGYRAAAANQADGNIAIGQQALEHNTFGETNVAIGYQSLFSNTTGNKNLA